jgi:hypothetical protein
MYELNLPEQPIPETTQTSSIFQPSLSIALIKAFNITPSPHPQHQSVGILSVLKYSS